MRYLAIFGKNRYPRFLAESRNVLDDRLSTLICQPSTSVESTGSHISSLKLDTVAGDAGPPSIVAVFRNENEFTEESCNSSFTLLFSFFFFFCHRYVKISFEQKRGSSSTRVELNENPRISLRFTTVRSFFLHVGHDIVLEIAFIQRSKESVREREIQAQQEKQKVREISIDRTSGKINCTRNLFDPTLISSVLVRSRLL